MDQRTIDVVMSSRSEKPIVRTRQASVKFVSEQKRGLDVGVEWPDNDLEYDADCETAEIETDFQGQPLVSREYFHISCIAAVSEVHINIL